MREAFVTFGALVRALCAAALSSTVGGQAVMEGVMMRKAGRLAVAVRKQNGEIVVETWPWFSLITRFPVLKRPFLRGFPVLVETLYNGIKALNYSAGQAVDEEEELKPWHLALTMVAALALALGLFVVLPHAFSYGMELLGLGGDMTSLSFHAWDGLFKLAIFLGYIAAISLVPDIKRVFQYHGAEHKVIWAYESSCAMEPEIILTRSRLHPRCGTAFLLFVLSLSIILHAVLAPPFLALYSPEATLLRHGYIVVVKLFLMVPISAASYELIKYAGKHCDSPLGRFISAPGLLLQRLTTKEPDEAQVEVALTALNAALAEGDGAEGETC